MADDLFWKFYRVTSVDKFLGEDKFMIVSSVAVRILIDVFFED